MNVRNIEILNSTAAADGAWIDISNMVSLSVQVSGYAGQNVWVEVSNDPNIPWDGPNGQLAAPAAPTLSQFTFNAGSVTVPTTQYGAPSSQPGSGLPAQQLSIMLTYVTRGNQPPVVPTPLYSTITGETLPGAASAISVLAGNICLVAPPPADAAGIATGYNVYAQLGGVGPYVLQNIRGGPNASNDQFVYDGPIPLKKPFAMKVGFFNSTVVAPVADTSGGPGSGTNIFGTGKYFDTATPEDAPIALVVDTGSTSAFVAPSSMTWKWLRVNKSGSGTATQAWICGQLG